MKPIPKQPSLRKKGRKKISLLLLLDLLFSITLWAQPVPEYFNTGANSAITPNYSALIPNYWLPPATSSIDQRWQVSSTGPFSGYGPAYKTWVAGWAADVSAYPAHGWISDAFGCSSGDPANHGCLPGPQDRWFRIQFNLPTSAPFAVNWNMWTDNSIISVYVNSVVVASPNGGSYSSPIQFARCTGWNAGNNSIVVHVRSGVQLPDDWLGLKVQSLPTTLSVTGPTNVCASTSGHIYNVSGGSGIMNYQWQNPSGWSGIPSANQSTLNASSTPGPGTLTVYGQNGVGCAAVGTLAVNVMPLPTVGIVASPSVACPGSPVVLTATGAATYSWSAPIPSTSATSNSVMVRPTVPTFYQLTGWGANGCQATVALQYNLLPLPQISITAQPAVYCFGATNTLTAGGAFSYTWMPSVIAGSTLAVAPTGPNTSYSVVGQGSNGCVSSTVITLPQGPTIPLSTSNVTICSDIAPCTTISASSNFQFPVSFSWSPAGPGGPNQSSMAICPPTSTAYIVTASSNSGCTSYSFVTVQVQFCCPPATATFALPTSTVCNPSYFNLAQYASVPGTFSGAGVTFTNGQYNFNSSLNLSPGSYGISFTYTTAPWGCTYTLVDYVVVTAPLPVAMEAHEHCVYSTLVGSTLGATLTNAPPATPVTYLWYPGAVFAQTLAVTPTVATIYTVFAMYSGCVSAGQVTMTINYTCCPQLSVTPAMSFTTLTAGTGTSSLTGPVVIDKDLTISGNGNFTFQNGDFIIGMGVKITLQQGVNLVLSQAHLYGCDAMWDGIVVENGANVTSAPVPNGLCSMIEDAATAIDVGNIGPGHATPLLNLDGVIFNRNWTGISFHNSSLTSIPSLVKSCVFTSRDLPTGTMSWPSSSSTNPQGLRYSTTALTDIAPPFMLNPAYPVNPPIGTTNLPGGISITDINNTPGGAPSPGVNLTAWANPAAGEFNLFDYMMVGIYVSDASLTTYNNTFQNMGIAGIDHITSGTINARLSLTSPVFATGNRFWHNFGTASQYISGNWEPNGIIAANILEFDIEEATFRGNFTPSGNSGYGIQITSNRFNNYNIRRNTFSNQPKGGIYMGFADGAYNVPNAFPANGVYAGSMHLYRNYFVPYPPAGNIVPGTVMKSCITINGANTGNWYIPGLNGSTVVAPNFIERNNVYMGENGIAITGMENYPLGIIDNNIHLDNTFLSPPPASQYGIHVRYSQGHKTIRNNYMWATGGNSWNNAIYHITGVENVQTAITCNTVVGGFAGFTFWGANTGDWRGNQMDNNIIGLYLRGYTSPTPYPCSIGVQGTPGVGTSGNTWVGSWPAGTFGTWVDAPSNPAASFLFLTSAPPNNGGQQPYIPGNSYVVVPGTYSCELSNLVQRPSLTTSLEESATGSGNIRFYPNPAEDHIVVESGLESEALKITITDAAGKMVYTGTSVTSNYSCRIKLPFEQGVYFVKIIGQNEIEFNKKLILSR